MQHRVAQVRRDSNGAAGSRLWWYQRVWLQLLKASRLSTLIPRPSPPARA